MFRLDILYSLNLSLNLYLLVSSHLVFFNYLLLLCFKYKKLNRFKIKTEHLYLANHIYLYLFIRFLHIKIIVPMDIMDTARFNIKRRREIKGLRQQDMADKLCMSLRSYQSLENGETKLDIERLERIAGILETNMEEFLRPEGYYIHQEIKEASGAGSGSGSCFGNENIHNNGIDKEIVSKLLEVKDAENQSLKDEIKYLKEDNKYMKDKIDQLMELMGKKE
jgi:transcriptional regulator with XRE-family HTH domain